jgi:hypothetical protein
MPLSGHIILIVESETASFGHELQRVLEEAGAETLLARDVEMARLRVQEFEFTAVVASIDKADIEDCVVLPTLLYGPDATERDPHLIQAALAGLLANG